jgi:hypothetical protein
LPPARLQDFPGSCFAGWLAVVLEVELDKVASMLLFHNSFATEDITRLNWFLEPDAAAWHLTSS